MGGEAEVSNHIEGLEEQWAELLDKIAEKGQKLREANQQQQYNEAVKDIDFWLGGLEAQLVSEDCGRDLAAVQNLLKKHHLLEADIAAHEVHELTILLFYAKIFVGEMFYSRRALCIAGTKDFIHYACVLSKCVWKIVH